MITKVYGYVLRRGADGPGVLVFAHRDFPEAGYQVPGGTVDPGESLEAAMLRELEEESGLTGAAVLERLEPVEYYSPQHQEWQRRHFFLLQAPPGCPERWQHTVTHGERDRDLVFCYEWWPVNRACAELAGGKGAGLAAWLAAWRRERTSR